MQYLYSVIVIGLFFNCQVVAKIQIELCHHTVFEHFDKDNLGYTEWILMGEKTVWYPN